MSIKNSGDILNKISNRSAVSSLSTYDFSTLYTTLPHNLIKDKLNALIRQTFARENTRYLACNNDKAFFTDNILPRYTTWTCNEVCEALRFLLDNIFVRFGCTVHMHTVGIYMGIK